MASTLSHSLNIPFSSPKPSHKSHQLSQFQPLKPFLNPSKPATLSLSTTPSSQHHYRHLVLTRATENGAQTDNEPETQQPLPEEAQTSNNDKLSEVGEEIKKAMKEREMSEGNKDGFWSGVVEEIGMIEWPLFGKVLGTTGVVLAVIAGSSLVLLTLNALLAELSDQLFVGKGVQDFFAG